MARHLRAAVVATALVILVGPLATAVRLTSVPAVYAWDGAKSVVWAEAHWNDCGNGALFTKDGYLCFNQNCTAFASEALHAGGYSWVQRGYWEFSWFYDDPDDRRWDSDPDYDVTFSYAHYLYDFLVYWDHDNNSTGPGGGFLKYINNGVSSSQISNKLGLGGLIFMDTDMSASDWHGIDHTRVEVGWNYTPWPPYRTPPEYYAAWNAFMAPGDYADQSSYNRKHDFWNGVYWVVIPQKVRIFQVQPDSANR